MARLRYMKNARTGDAGTVCESDLLINGDLEVTGTTNLDLTVVFDQSLLENFTVGETDSGYDVRFWGSSGSSSWLWDASLNKVVVTGAFDIAGNIAVTGNITSVSGTLGVTGATTLAAATLSGALTANSTTALNRKVTITPNAAGTFLDFVLDAWVSGTLIEAAFDGATTVNDDLIAMLLDLNGNVTMTTHKDVVGYQLKLPAFTQSAANTTLITGFELHTAGNLVQDSAEGTITWKGINLVMPLTNASTGYVNAYGIYITSGTKTTDTQIGVYVAGTLTDGFKMHATATDGLEISGDCTNFININNVADTSAVALHFVSAFLGHSIETGTYQNTGDGGVILDSTNTFNAGFLADDSGSNIGASVRNVLARTLITAEQFGGSIRSVMGQLKILDTIDVGTGVYTAVQGYIELAGDTDVKSGGKMSCIDASLEIADSKTLDVKSGGYFAGVKIEATAGDGGTATFTQGGTVAAVYIDTVGTIEDWNVGVDVNDCTTGIDIGSGTIGISMTGLYATAAISIDTALAASGDYAILSTTSNVAMSGTQAHNAFIGTMTGAGAVGRVVFVDLTVDDVAAGGYVNAFKAQMDFDTSGSCTGLASVACLEMVSPGAATTAGSYAILELELKASANYTTDRPTAYIWVQLSGDGTALDVLSPYFLNHHFCLRCPRTFFFSSSNFFNFLAAQYAFNPASRFCSMGSILFGLFAWSACLRFWIYLCACLLISLGNSLRTIILSFPDQKPSIVIFGFLETSSLVIIILSSFPRSTVFLLLPLNNRK